MRTFEIVQIGLVVVEISTALIGICYWKKFRHNHWKWFVIYLTVIAVCEIAGNLMTYWLKNRILNKDFYNNLVIPLEFLFFFRLYYQYIKKKTERYWLLAGAAFYLLCWLINALVLPGIKFWSLPFSYMTGIIVLLASIIAFFSRFVSGDDILGFKTNMMFWISLGLLIFYLVSSPFFSIRGVLYAKYREVFWIYYYIQFGVNYLMYVFFSIALIWGKPR